MIAFFWYEPEPAVWVWGIPGIFVNGGMSRFDECVADFRKCEARRRAAASDGPPAPLATSHSPSEPPGATLAPPRPLETVAPS